MLFQENLSELLRIFSMKIFSSSLRTRCVNLYTKGLDINLFVNYIFKLFFSAKINNVLFSNSQYFFSDRNYSIYDAFETCLSKVEFHFTTFNFIH